MVLLGPPRPPAGGILTSVKPLLTALLHEHAEHTHTHTHKCNMCSHANNTQVALRWLPATAWTGGEEGRRHCRRCGRYRGKAQAAAEGAAGAERAGRGGMGDRAEATVTARGDPEGRWLRSIAGATSSPP